jgi:RNase P subunit RPR2
MKSIKEYEDEVRRRYATPNITGIECPNCKHELQFVNRHVVMLSSPPQTNVICYNCNYEDRVVV